MGQTYLSKDKSLQKIRAQDWYNENYKVLNANKLIDLHKEMVDNLTQIDKHWIRAIIKKKHQVIRYQVRAVDQSDNDKPYEHGKHAMVALNCENYHNFHRDTVNEKYFDWKQIKEKKSSFIFVCPICKSKNKITDLFVDALYLSFFKFLNKISKTAIYFFKKSIPQDINYFLKQYINNKNDLKTLVIDQKQKKENGVQFWQTFITSRPDEQVVQKLNKYSDKNESIEYLKKLNFTDKIKVNLLCFIEKKRIFNPLIHKDCKHYQEEKKLAVFSFEYVYRMTRQKKNVYCFFPGCKSQFTYEDFDQSIIEKNQSKVILSSNFRRQFYKQKMFYLLGQFSNGVFLSLENQIQKTIDHLFNTELGDLRNEKINNIHNFLEIQQKIQSLIKNTKNVINQKTNIDTFYTNLKQGYEKNKIISKRYVQFCYESDKNISSSTPVRCKKCTKNKENNQKYYIQDAWYIMCNFFFNEQSKNIVCQQCKTLMNKLKGIYEYFILDVRVCQFFYLQGAKHSKFYYDCQKDLFVSRLDSYKGSQILKKSQVFAKTVNLQSMIFSYSQLSYPKLQSNKQYYAFIHDNCLNKIKMGQKSYIYICKDQKPKKQQTKCPTCQAQLYISNIIYDKILSQNLKRNNNQINENPLKQYQKEIFFKNNLKIEVIQKYNQNSLFQKVCKNNFLTIKQKIFCNKKENFVYVKNMRGKIMKNPIVLPCQHSLQTRIFDYDDIAIFIQNDKAQIQCRYKYCQKEYSKKDNIFRIAKQSFINQIQTKEVYKKLQLSGFFVCLDKKLQKLVRILDFQEVVKQKLDENNFKTEKDIIFSNVGEEEVKQLYPQEYLKLTSNKQQRQIEQDEQQLESKVVHFGNSFVFPQRMHSYFQKN